MARTDRRETQASSTVEAIRMASASVLGVTTGLGYPLGSAIGTGNVLEEHSETASMNIAPLIFSIRDTLLSAENLELLSIEWDLDRKPGPQIVPEQLVVAGGSEGGTGSHVCVLTWEKGVVDPFKIDAYMKVLAKKIADVETAILNNEITYEPEGLAVMGDFADRLNSVLFVDMIDRRFQGSWDSQQVKADSVDVDLEAKMNIRDDFTILPPGPKVTSVKELEFRLPSSAAGIKEFENRVLTPSAIKALTVDVPEAGQAILRELNEYAYSQEEADIVKSTIEVLRSHLNREQVTLAELSSLEGDIADFGKQLQSSVTGLEHIVEDHVGSGKALSIDGHREAILSAVAQSSELSARSRSMAEAMAEEMMKSVARENLQRDEIRAWELKSTLRYSIDHAKRISQYFIGQLQQYLVLSSARSAFQVALSEFRKEVLTEDMDSTDQILFEKFYGEVKAQLEAAFAKQQYSRGRFNELSSLMESVTREMIDVFRLTDVWSLIGFDDVSRVAKAEIEKKHSVPEGTGNLTEYGRSLMNMLEIFEALVSDTIPDVADTILSKPLVRRMIDEMVEQNTSVLEVLSNAVEGAAEKPDIWKAEARDWVSDFRGEGIDALDSPEAMLSLLQFVHEKLGAAVTPSAMADRVKTEADLMEQEYQKRLNEWNEERERIEAENERIRANNEKREELLRVAKEEHDARLIEYEAKLRHYQDLMQQRRVQSVRVPEPDVPEGAEGLDADTKPDLGPPPVEPAKPAPIGPRLKEIEDQYPAEEAKAVPAKPEPDSLLTRYTGLRDLLDGKLADMKDREKSMEDLFARRVLRLQAEGMEAAKSVSIDIGTGLFDHIMQSRVRRLGGLLPRVSRVYLRDPKSPDLVYLVSYKHFGDTLSVSIGSTSLR